MRPYLSRLAALAALLPLGTVSFMALADAPDPARWLTAPMPAEWQYTEGLQQTLPECDNWWAQFEDPYLVELIETARENNFNILAAYRRIQAAKAQLAQTRAGYWPTVGLNLSWNRERDSGRLTDRFGKAAPVADYFDLGLSASWEIDIFGRVREKAKASKASLDATKAEYTGAMVTLTANLAKTFIQLRLDQAQFNITKAHLSSQEKVVRLTEARMEAGIGNKLEVSQAREVYLSTQNSLTSLQAAIDADVNSLALLTGLYPDAIAPKLRNPYPLPILLEVPACGIPADLLRRRPDILQAEQQLAQAAAQAGVAKKDFLPTLSISAEASTQAHWVGDLFSYQSLGYVVAPTLSWTIFDGFARKAAVAEARADMEEAIDDYNQTVHTAVQEVNTAMSALRYSVQAVQQQLELLKQTQESLDLSLQLYKKGLTQFSNVVTAQINVLNEENNLVSLKAASLADAVTLYEALGGGFQAKRTCSDQLQEIGEATPGAAPAPQSKSIKVDGGSLQNEQPSSLPQITPQSESSHEQAR